MAVDVCTLCGGVYFDFGELANLIRRYPEQLTKLEALVKTPQAELDPAAQQQTIHCPVCATGMEPYRYAGSTDIWLNDCPQCNSVWVDHGELEAIKAHVDLLEQDMKDHVSDSCAPTATGVDWPEQDWLGVGLLGALIGRRWL
jgi:Zn-finger nucleic acid-binding protein